MDIVSSPMEMHVCQTYVDDCRDAGNAMASGIRRSGEITHRADCCESDKSKHWCSDPDDGEASPKWVTSACSSVSDPHAFAMRIRDNDNSIVVQFP